MKILNMLLFNLADILYVLPDPFHVRPRSFIKVSNKSWNSSISLYHNLLAFIPTFCPPSEILQKWSFSSHFLQESNILVSSTDFGPGELGIKLHVKSLTRGTWWQSAGFSRCEEIELAVVYWTDKERPCRKAEEVAVMNAKTWICKVRVYSNPCSR